MIYWHLCIGTVSQENRFATAQYRYVLCYDYDILHLFGSYVIKIKRCGRYMTGMNICPTHVGSLFHAGTVCHDYLAVMTVPIAHHSKPIQFFSSIQTCQSLCTLDKSLRNLSEPSPWRCPIRIRNISPRMFHSGAPPSYLPPSLPFLPLCPNHLPLHFPREVAKTK